MLNMCRWANPRSDPPREAKMDKHDGGGHKTVRRTENTKTLKRWRRCVDGPQVGACGTVFKIESTPRGLAWLSLARALLYESFSLAVVVSAWVVPIFVCDLGCVGRVENMRHTTPARWWQRVAFDCQAAVSSGRAPRPVRQRIQAAASVRERRRRRLRP